MTTPDRLIERLRAGDAAAFNEVYRVFHPRLFSYLRRLAGESSLAEDLFQETWAKLARKCHDLPDDINLEAWLFTVARNGFFDHRRWRIFDMKRLQGFFELPRSESQQSDTVVALDDALARLGNADRELLLLIAETALDLEGVAVVMNISYAALRQRLSRARTRLATILAQEGIVWP